MLAVRRRLDDCSCLSLLGTARGDTWWQVSEASWDRPRGTGPGFWRESHTAGHAIARRFGVNGVVRNLACTRHCARARAPPVRPQGTSALHRSYEMIPTRYLGFTWGDGEIIEECGSDSSYIFDNSDGFRRRRVDRKRVVSGNKEKQISNFLTRLFIYSLMTVVGTVECICE